MLFICTQDNEEDKHSDLLKSIEVLYHNSHSNLRKLG